MIFSYTYYYIVFTFFLLLLLCPSSHLPIPLSLEQPAPPSAFMTHHLGKPVIFCLSSLPFSYLVLTAPLPPNRRFLLLVLLENWFLCAATAEKLSGQEGSEDGIGGTPNVVLGCSGTEVLPLSRRS